MAQKFVSPGVFTTEFDQSFLAQGVAGIGATIIGRTPKGPAFVPTFVQGFDDFVDRFGSLDKNMMVPYSAKNYLKNAAAMTIVRVLGHADGTSVSNGYTPISSTGIVDSPVNGQVLAVVHHSGAAGQALSVVGVDANNFIVSVGTFAATASFLTSSANYISKVLNTDPTLFSTYGHYLYTNYSYVKPLASASGDWAVVAMSGGLNSFDRDFEGGFTAWVKSQPVGGPEFNLFRFASLPHGRETNDDTKVMIANVKPSASPSATPYGSFDVIVRQFGDTDQKVVSLESFVGVSLDPVSPNFIARRIGDYYETFDTTQRKFIATGDFKNKSKLIRVEMSTGQNSPKEALPWGHRGYTRQQFVSGAFIPSFKLTVNQFDRNGNLDPNISFGISFVSGGVADRMRAEPNNATSFQTNDTEFSLSYLTSSYTNGKQIWSYGVSSIHQPIYASASLYKFSLPLQGGFDGFDLRTTDPLYLANSADETNKGVVSLKRALDTISNPDAFDMNLLSVPGVHNLKVTDYGRSIANDRADVLFLMDVTGSSVAEVVGLLNARDLDDNYSAAYYPDLKLNDKVNQKIVRVTPSVAVLGAIAFSDRVGQVFFAPAGLNRGGLGQFDIVDVIDRLNFTDRNVLYDNRINPIATFPNEGIVVFGQKTLQVKASALDRINVRRLLIFAKKTIASAAKFLLFDPDNAQTWQRFTNLVNPILEKVRQDQGLVRFKVVMDSTTNTADVIDRNAMFGKIFLQPTKASEFIDLAFIITNAGVSFDE